MKICNNYYEIIAVFIILIFINTEVFSQTPTDTVQVRVSETVYETVTVRDTLMKIDTVWIEGKSDALSILTGTFNAGWRKYDTENLEISNRKAFSIMIICQIGMNRWTFSTGAAYSLYKKNVNFNYSNINIDTVVKDFSYNYLEFPLKFNYVIAQTNKFDFDIGIGFIAGLLIKSESYYFKNNDIYRIENRNIYQFLPSLCFSVGIEYYITDYFSARIEPYYYFGLRSVYKKDAPIVKIPDRQGVLVGLKVYF